MSTELQNMKESKSVVNLKEANNKKEQGDSEIKTSCLFCKFKPNCEDAIPFYIQAADMYHSAGQWKEEIYCREKLVFCHRFLKSFWEEGNQQEKIAYIYFKALENNESAINAITNAYQCYFTAGDYKDSVDAVKKLGHQFYLKKDVDSAERLLKIGYEGFLQVFHTLSTKKDEPYEFLYSALDQYCAILITNNKVRVAIGALESAIKNIEQYEENKSKILHVFGFLLLTLIINEDVSKLNEISESAKQICSKNSEFSFIENILNLGQNIKEGKESDFRDNMIEINVDYPNEVGKKLNILFYDTLGRINKQKIATEKIHEEENNEEMDHVIIVDDNRNEEKDDYL